MDARIQVTLALKVSIFSRQNIIKTVLNKLHLLPKNIVELNRFQITLIRGNAFEIVDN